MQRWKDALVATVLALLYPVASIIYFRGLRRKTARAWWFLLFGACGVVGMAALVAVFFLPVAWQGVMAATVGCVAYFYGFALQADFLYRLRHEAKLLASS